ncbi:hypothetical protein GYA19_04030 [Candidatus Beckwithbacteria bacterium]|nr:hypothetical protein [Candidatus Beckwithbacteria bacterium]
MAKHERESELSLEQRVADGTGKDDLIAKLEADELDPEANTQPLLSISRVLLEQMQRNLKPLE